MICIEDSTRIKGIAHGFIYKYFRLFLSLTSSLLKPCTLKNCTLNYRHRRSESRNKNCNKRQAYKTQMPKIPNAARRKSSE